MGHRIHGSTSQPTPTADDGDSTWRVTHASGLTFKVIPGTSPLARVARGVRQLTMTDGTEWTVGTPVGWRGISAAWQNPETPDARAARISLYGESIQRRDRTQLGLRSTRRPEATA
ncbi:hypothetical protein ACIP68_22985 [Streptomyces griseoviridis]